LNPGGVGLKVVQREKERVLKPPRLGRAVTALKATMDHERRMIGS